MASENVRIGIYDFAAGTTVWLGCDDFGHDQYLTGVTWSPDGNHILVQVLDRSQKHLRLNMYDSSTGRYVRTILTEDNDRYVEPQDPVWFLEGSDDTFIYRTDNRDGYRNLYLCDFDGNVRRLTQTDADVAYIGNDGKNVYYTSAEVSPVGENHLFRVGVRNGKTARLTSQTGWHTVSLSPDCSCFADSYSSLCVPRVIDVCSTSGNGRDQPADRTRPRVGVQVRRDIPRKIRSADGEIRQLLQAGKAGGFRPGEEIPRDSLCPMEVRIHSL